MRIFSHTCSNTEIVCALGCADQLVGIDADSDHPPEVVAALPKLGRDLNLDTAAVLALRPDIVLTSLTVPGHEKVVAELQARGLQTLVCDPQSLDDVFSDIRRIADRLGASARGARLVANMQAAMPAVDVSWPRPRVLVEWWPKPVIVPARRSWVNALIERAGGTNPLATDDAKSVTLEPARAQAIDPQAIVMSWCGVRVEKYRAEHVRLRCGWAGISALRSDRIYPISEEFLGRPGPRLVEGYRHLRAIVETVRRTAQPT